VSDFRKGVVRFGGALLLGSAIVCFAFVQRLPAEDDDWAQPAREALKDGQLADTSAGDVNAPWEDLLSALPIAPPTDAETPPAQRSPPSTDQSSLHPALAVPTIPVPEPTQETLPEAPITSDLFIYDVEEPTQEALPAQVQPHLSSSPYQQAIPESLPVNTKPAQRPAERLGRRGEAAKERKARAEIQQGKSTRPSTERLHPPPQARHEPRQGRKTPVIHEEFRAAETAPSQELALPQGLIPTHANR
jgi:hypothetical protein